MPWEIKNSPYILLLLWMSYPWLIYLLLSLALRNSAICHITKFRHNNEIFSKQGTASDDQFRHVKLTLPYLCRCAFQAATELLTWVRMITTIRFNGTRNKFIIVARPRNWKNQQSKILSCKGLYFWTCYKDFIFKVPHQNSSIALEVL